MEAMGNLVPPALRVASREGIDAPVRDRAEEF